MDRIKNNKKICVIGAGDWGMNHIKTLSLIRSLGGVVDSNIEQTSKVKDLFPSVSIFENINDAIKQKFDGFVVATPPKTHFEISKTLIQAGFPVLVEKPLTLDYHSATSLNNLAKDRKVLLMVGHLLLFHPAFQKMKNIINNGDIGEIQYIYSNRLNLGTFRNDENVFWSFAPHDISLFNYFFDEKPRNITSRGVDILQKDIHDTTITSFNYSSGKMGHIFVSWLHPFKEHRFVIIGSKGMLRFEDSLDNKPLIFYSKGVDYSDSVPKPKNGEVKKIDYNNELPLTNQLKYFLSNLKTDKIELANGDSAVEVVRILEEATNSLKGDN